MGTEDEQKLFNDNDQIGISVNGGAAHKYEMKNGVWGVAESVVPINGNPKLLYSRRFIRIMVSAIVLTREKSVQNRTQRKD